MTHNRLFDGIVIFVHIVKHGGFSAAAHELGHSTSFISKALNKLEEKLEVRLLNRTTRSISLTPEGKIYYQHCLQLIDDAESAIDLVTQNDFNPKGRLKVSCPVQFAHSHLTTIIEKYLSRYPNVNVDLNLSDRHLDVIGDGYDLVIRATAQLDESSLICRKIYSAKGYTVAAKAYLDRHGLIYHPRELSKHQCICYSNLKFPTKWDYLEKDGRHFVVDVKDKITCNDGNMLLSMALAGQGVVRLPDFYLNEHINNGNLTVLFADLPTKPIDVFAIYPSKQHLSPKVRAFIDLITEQFN